VTLGTNERADLGIYIGYNTFTFRNFAGITHRDILPINIKMFSGKPTVTN
jgi:hypothetical protein